MHEFGRVSARLQWRVEAAMPKSFDQGKVAWSTMLVAILTALSWV
jgi:hypothetical protein